MSIIYKPFKIIDETQGDSFILYGAITDNRYNTRNDSTTYNASSNITAAYPDFPVQATFFSSILTSHIEKYNEKGFNSVYSTVQGDIYTRLNHTFTFENGFTGIFKQNGDARYFNYVVQSGSNTVRIAINGAININSGVMFSAVGFDGTNLQSFHIIGINIPFPSASGHGFHFNYDSYHVQQIPIITTPTAFELQFWESLSTPADPYANGGTSTSGGGGGSFDDSTDVIQIPEYDPIELLNRGFANRGFVSVYLPTQAQVLALSNYLWSSGIDNTLKKLYADPIQSIIALSMIPLIITGTNTGNIYIAHTDTEISNVMIADNQFATLNCGTIDLDEFWGSYLDYSPYTKLSIYLPFIGVRALNIDEFMSGTIEVKYVIDIVSGDCIAFISRVGSTDNLTVPVPAILGVLYQFNGNVSLQVPISAANFAQMYGASISAAVGGVGMLAGAITGGLSAPMAISGIAATAVNVASSKPSISHGGSIPSTAGWLGVQKPYLILQRPQQCLPEDQNTLTGYPAYVTVTIGDVEGYNEFEIMHLENIPATEQEKDEIERLLKSGVIL